MQTEIWKSIAGFEGQYEVSQNGRVRSLPRDIDSNGAIKNYRGVELTPRLTDDGDLFVMMSYRGQKRRALLRVLVLEAFLGPRPDRHIARHKNGDQRDCSFENLEWAPNSMRRRSTHRVRHG